MISFMIFVILTIITGFAEGTLEPKMLFTEAVRCQEESLATRADIHKVALRMIPETTSGKCLLRCMLKNFGVTVDGEYNKENTLEFLKKSYPERPMMLRDLEDLSENCQYLNDQIPEHLHGSCEHAYALATCIQANLEPGEIDRDKAVALYKKCQEQTKAEESQEDIFEKHIIPSSDAGKCMVECMLTDLQLLKDGKLDYEATMKLIERVHGDNPEKAEVAVKVLEECKDVDVSGLEGCDAAVKYMACIKEKKMDIIV